MPSGPGFVRLRLVNVGREAFHGFRLGFTSIVTLSPPAGSPVRLVEHVGSYHEIAAPEDVVLAPGAVWDVGNFQCGVHLSHANDGPVNAFLIRADGSAASVRAVPTELGAILKVGNDAPPAVALKDPSDVTAAAWSVAAACEKRLYPDAASVLASRGAPVEARIDSMLGTDDFALVPAGGSGWTVIAGSKVSLQWALLELARRQRGHALLGGTSFTPKSRFRGLMIDLSRNFIPAVDVGEVIDLAAWRKLNVVHLHLTDDEGWRIPIAAYPALADVAAWRGYGQPIPPLHSSSAEPYGGCYTAEEIRGWVTRAADLGIELIPEVDVPGHSYATIVALPELFDRGDTGTVESVQYFRSNVLNPGLPATRTFLEAVFGEVADLFPGSRVHIGCDEVVTGAWDASPAATRWAADHGLEGHAAIEKAFVTEIVDIVRKSTGRRLGAWQEAAEFGGLQPGDGYVVGWRDSEVCRTLAEEGYDVVASPAAAYYLDMAEGPDWHLPGHFWAGNVTSDVIASYDPTAGWDESSKARLLGIQASLWGEHVTDRRTMRAMLLPRLDAFGEAGWQREWS